MLHYVSRTNQQSSTRSAAAQFESWIKTISRFDPNTTRTFCNKDFHKCYHKSVSKYYHVFVQRKNCTPINQSINQCAFYSGLSD